MDISSMSSTLTPNQSSVRSPWQQIAKDFQTLQGAIQSRDTSSAQKALAAVRDDWQSSAKANSTTGHSSQISTDLQTIQMALKSDDVSAAQKAFATLQQDMKAGLITIAVLRQATRSLPPLPSNTTPSPDSNIDVRL